MDNNLIRKTSVSKFYRAWVNMKSRCNNPNASFYRYYGGRGIGVCNKWKTFDGFIEDMLPSYQDKLTLDRIDNDGNYCKENCRWVNAREQVLNSRKVKNATHITHNGITRTITEWAIHLGIKRRTLGMRLLNYGWSIDRALTTGGQIA